MRIAFVLADPGIPVFGTKGASVHVQAVVTVLLRHGHEVELFCRRPGDAASARGPLAEAIRDERLRIHDAGRPAASRPEDRERLLIDGDADVRRALEAADTERPFDAVYERYALFSRAGADFALARALPFVLEVNAPLPIEQARHRGLVHAAEADENARRVLEAATVAVCVSEPVAAWARAVAPGARLAVEPNGVDPERFSAPAARDDEPFTIGFVGTLKPWHGTEILIDAFDLVAAARPDARLVLVGDGPERAELERRARRLAIRDRVVFTGAVEPDAVPAHLAGLHVAVAPYPAGDEEAYFSPLKVIEYMAAGLAVVASRVGQLPALVDDGRTGVLVPGSDAVRLAEALLALAGDPERRRAMGRAARAEVEATRTWRHIVERTFAAVGLALSQAGVRA